MFCLFVFFFHIKNPLKTIRLNFRFFSLFTYQSLVSKIPYSTLFQNKLFKITNNFWLDNNISFWNFFWYILRLKSAEQSTAYTHWLTQLYIYIEKRNVLKYSTKVFVTTSQIPVLCNSKIPVLLFNKQQQTTKKWINGCLFEERFFLFHCIEFVFGICTFHFIHNTCLA